MSNTLYITVGKFNPIGNTNPDNERIIVLAGDSYGNDSLTFDTLDDFLSVYPTKDSLVDGILELPAFEDVTETRIIVEGYPE